MHATGGTVTYDGGDTIHTFTGNGTLVVTGYGTSKILLIGGGGAGGKCDAGERGCGGGGAGGLIYNESFGVTAGSYPVVIGIGGDGSYIGGGYPHGGNSTFSNQTAVGGGQGGYYNSGFGSEGGDGGSGGGTSSVAADEGGEFYTHGGAPTSGQGYSGAVGSVSNSINIGGGGGGASEAGQTYNGGDGVSISITGSPVTYAGGGGGGSYTSNSPGSGGSGGGGNGTQGGAGNPGTDYLGAGGGGAGPTSGAGFDGGDGGIGIFIIRYTPNTTATVATGSGSAITASTATLGGNITADGGENPSVRGFQYGKTGSYGTDIHETGLYPTGAYTLNLSGLDSNTLYYFRAYVTNSAGTTYGSQGTFTTLKNLAKLDSVPLASIDKFAGIEDPNIKKIMSVVIY